ncbi:splicing coactivator subunit-like protein [Burkholderia thailandensis E264]|uniref:Splicing coactivator subunit-like protein n=1 Tax=Burkholderia thailandensis (strain ATCC 700388 / DSM 13276 / CCUG 48851 / CIP 106301 / E264) TaxID=271848 RepID=Q2T3P8_BURTA|nr:splicing coactivator subunit-like protein [Burkholderia thailandensis E264]
MRCARASWKVRRSTWATRWTMPTGPSPIRKPGPRMTVNHHAVATGLMGRVQQHLFAALGVTRHPRTTH